MTDVPAHLYRALNGRLQDNDREGAIELCFELLSSGRSVGEILNEVGPVRSNPEHRDTATAEQPRSGPEPDRAASDIAPGIAAAGTARADAPDARRPSVLDETGTRATGKPPETRSPPPGEFGSDSREPRPRRSLSGSEPRLIGTAGARTPQGREAAAGFAERERFRSGRFASIATSIAFWALYTGAVAAASIAGFSILRGGRDIEPAITGVRPHAPRGAEAVAMPGARPDAAADRSAADSSAAVEETATPLRQTASTGASQAPEPSRPGEPDPAALIPAAPIPVGARNTVSAAREAETPQRPDAGQPDAFEHLIEQLAEPAAARDPAHDPAVPVAQSASAALIEATAGEPRSDAGWPDTGEKPQAANNEAARTAAASASASPPQAQAAQKPEARTPRRHAGSRQSANRRTARRQPAHAGRGPGANLAATGAGSRSVDSARGYGYGAYGPTPYSDTGD